MLAMICDDDPSSRFVMKRLLTQHLGCATIECEDGVDALTQIDRQHVDLLLLDLNMPTMDGLEMLEAIRSSPAQKHLPVVAVSNERREDVIRRLLVIGVDGYVLKPVRSEKILGVLDRLRPRLGERSKRSAAAGLRDVCLGPDSPAMLVDGNLDYRHFFVSQAQRFGPIVEAASGAAALSAWKTAPTPLVFVGADLGLMDAPRLVPKLRALSAGAPLRLVRLVDGKIDPHQLDGCDDAMGRSFIADVFRHGIKAFVRSSGPLTAVSQLVGDPATLVASAARQVFGMMLDTELIATAAPADSGPHAGAVGTITVAHEFAVSFKLFAAAASLAVVAGRMLNLPTTEVSSDDATSAAGELVNLITGRLHAVMDERGVVSDCSLPTLVPERATWLDAASDESGVVLHFQLGDAAATVHMAFEVSTTATPA